MEHSGNWTAKMTTKFLPRSLTTAVQAWEPRSHGSATAGAASPLATRSMLPEDRTICARAQRTAVKPNEFRQSLIARNTPPCVTTAHDKLPRHRAASTPECLSRRLLRKRSCSAQRGVSRFRSFLPSRLQSKDRSITHGATGAVSRDRCTQMFSHPLMLMKKNMLQKAKPTH